MGQTEHRALPDLAPAEFSSENPTRFNGSEVLVFIPVRNEEATIAKVVAGVREACDFDLLVIDDGSVDNTPRILNQLDVAVLKHPAPLGPLRILNGLKTGQALGYKYVVKIDGDDQEDPRDIPRLYQHALTTGADIVVGSRHLNHFKANLFSIKGSGMWFSAKLVSFLAQQRFTDATSGFKIWNRQACELAIRASEKGKLKEGSTYHVEELIIATRQKLKVAEINIVIYPRRFGESKSFAPKKMVSYPLNLVRSTIRALR